MLVCLNAKHDTPTTNDTQVLASRQGSCIALYQWTSPCICTCSDMCMCAAKGNAIAGSYHDKWCTLDGRCM